MTDITQSKQSTTNSSSSDISLTGLQNRIESVITIVEDLKKTLQKETLTKSDFDFDKNGVLDAKETALFNFYSETQKNTHSLYKESLKNTQKHSIIFMLVQTAFLLLSAFVYFIRLH